MWILRCFHNEYTYNSVIVCVHAISSYRALPRLKAIPVIKAALQMKIEFPIIPNQIE